MAAMMTGVQFHLPTHGGTSIQELRHLAERCAASGASQIWVTDNLESRSLFAVLMALTPVPVKLGAAVMVQYLRNPVEAASAIATVSELMDSRELTIGLGRGNPHTTRMIEMPRPIGFMRETASFLKDLLAGETVDPRTYPLVSEYFRFVGEVPFRLTFRSTGPIQIFGGSSGPLGLRAARETMDGLVYNGTLFLPMLTLGRIAPIDAAAHDDLATPFGAVADVKVATTHTMQEARDFVRHSVATRVVSLSLAGFGEEEFRALGVEPGDADAIIRGRAAGEPAGRLAAMVSDPMIDAIFIAGDVGYCRERMTEVARQAEAVGFQQLMLSELGPDPAAACDLLLNEVMPHV